MGKAQDRPQRRLRRHRRDPPSFDVDGRDATVKVSALGTAAVATSKLDLGLKQTRRLAARNKLVFVVNMPIISHEAYTLRLLIGTVKTAKVP